jgi:hypothetical protein
MWLLSDECADHWPPSIAWLARNAHMASVHWCAAWPGWHWPDQARHFASDHIHSKPASVSVPSMSPSGCASESHIYADSSAIFQSVRGTDKHSCLCNISGSQGHAQLLVQHISQLGACTAACDMLVSWGHAQLRAHATHLAQCAVCDVERRLVDPLQLTHWHA